MIRLSIIIPAFNVALWIEATLRSILKSFPSGEDLGEAIEVIVVDDGSTDNTMQVVEKFIKAHPDLPPIRGIRGGLNQGVSAARNNGLAHAMGEYVWFVDGDDMIAPDALHHIFNIIKEHPGVDVIKTGLPVTFMDGEKITLKEYSTSKLSLSTGETDGVSLFNEPYNGLYICHGRHIWRREHLIENQLEYPVGITTNEDFCFTVQSILKAKTAVDAPWLRTYMYRKRENSVTGVRRSPEKFMQHVLSAQEALKQILKAPLLSPQGGKKEVARMRNLMIANNITYILGPLPLSFVRRMLRNLEAMGAYPFTPESDHSNLLRFVMKRKWAIIVVSQIRRLRFLLNLS